MEAIPILLFIMLLFMPFFVSFFTASVCRAFAILILNIIALFNIGSHPVFSFIVWMGALIWALNSEKPISASDRELLETELAKQRLELKRLARENKLLLRKERQEPAKLHGGFLERKT